MLRAWSLALLALSACQNVPPPRAAPPPKATATAAPAQKTEPATAAAPAEPNKPFRLAWTLQTRPFNKGLALSDSLVASLGSRHLALVEMRTGNIVKQRDVCFTFHGAFSFIGEKKAALVCEQTVQLLSVPDLELQGTRNLPGLARAAAFGAAHVAIAFEAGSVRLFSLDDGAVVAELPVGEGVVASLAVSADGRFVAAGLEAGEVLLLDREANAVHRMPVKRGLSIDTLSFDAEAKRLFTGAGPTAAVWNVGTRKVAHRFRSVSSVLAASWIGRGAIASGGRDGLLLLDVSTDAAKSIAGGLDGEEPPVSVVASTDGKVLCAAERDGNLACYARGKIPTRAIPTAAYGADDARMSGRVVSFIGKQRLTVKAHAHTTLPEPGLQVRVLRYHETTVGAVRSARWVELMRADVIKIKEDVVHLKAGKLEDVPGLSDPFSYDAPIRLVWKRK